MSSSWVSFQDLAYQSIPTASAVNKGLIKVGEGLDMSDETLSAIKYGTGSPSTIESAAIYIDTEKTSTDPVNSIYIKVG